MTDWGGTFRPVQLGASVAITAAALGFAPVPAPAQTSSQTAAGQSACGTRYTVRPGDTLDAIAERCGTSVEALTSVNEVIEDPARISVGWELAIPLPRASLGPASVVRQRGRDAAAESALAKGSYEVQPGDSFASIATALQVPMRALMEANGNVDPFALRPGQVLRLPDGASEGAAAAAAVQDDAADSTAPAVGRDEREAGRGEPEPGRTPEPGQAQDGTAPPTAPTADGEGVQERGLDRLTLQGRVQSGSECPVLETPEGETYSLVSAEYGFMPGEYVSIEGETVEMSFCMEGTATVRVTSMTAIPVPQGG